MRSEIEPATQAAYRRTQYRISDRLSLWIDRRSLSLADWHARYDVESSAFITAANPRSEQSSAHDNQVTHERLRTQLEREGLRYVEGAAIDPERRWPEEPGFLVAGLDRSHACRLGRQFDQNAVVWADADAVPQLVLLR